MKEGGQQIQWLKPSNGRQKGGPKKGQKRCNPKEPKKGEG